MEDNKQVKKKVFELTDEFVSVLYEIIAQKDDKQAQILLDTIHAADIAEIYDILDVEDAKFLFLLFNKLRVTEGY